MQYKDSLWVGLHQVPRWKRFVFHFPRKISKHKRGSFVKIKTVLEKFGRNLNPLVQKKMDENLADTGCSSSTSNTMNRADTAL